MSKLTKFNPVNCLSAITSALIIGCAVWASAVTAQQLDAVSAKQLAPKQVKPVAKDLVGAQELAPTETEVVTEVNEPVQINIIEGRIQSLQINDKGYNFGMPEKHFEANVIVRLVEDSKVYAFPLTKDERSLISLAMLESLRYAYHHDQSINLYYVTKLGAVERRIIAAKLKK